MRNSALLFLSLLFLNLPAMENIQFRPDLVIKKLPIMENIKYWNDPVIKKLPIDIWRIIFSYLPRKIPKTELFQFNELKKLKLLNRSFYAMCATNHIHSLVSSSLLTSAFLFNMEPHRAKLYHAVASVEPQKLQDPQTFEEALLLLEDATCFQSTLLIKGLIERGLNVNAVYGRVYKRTALCDATRRNNEKSVQCLLEFGHADINGVDEYMHTPLMIAAQYNYVALVRTFLKHPSLDLHRTNMRGESALIVAHHHRSFAAAALIQEAEDQATQYSPLRHCTCLVS